METKLLTSLGKIAGIGGIALGVLLLVYKYLLGTHFIPPEGLSSGQAEGVIRILLILTFGIAALGLIAWVMTHSLRKEDPVPMGSSIILAALSIGIILFAITAAHNPPNCRSSAIT